MKLLSWVINIICKISSARPGFVICFWLALAAVGFTLLPGIRISTDLVSGVGGGNEIIQLTSENHGLFGEQDALILVLEFPEPPGEARRPFIEGIANMLSNMPEIEKVIYRFLDPEDEQTMNALYANFLLGMGPKERVRISERLTPHGLKGALRRNQNRLFLAENPYLQNRIMDDPLELAMIISEAMKERVGEVSLGDPYLFLASPDSTMFLVHMTPAFRSSNVKLARNCMKKLRKLIPERIDELIDVIPGARTKFHGLKWHLTGKVVFHSETDILFDREVVLVLFASFILVSAFLILSYWSLPALAALMFPIVCAIGANYVVMYFTCREINPVVVGSLGILFGLGADFGVHLWGRLREERAFGAQWAQAVELAMQNSGPPVILGAMTSVIAFSCLGFSDQAAMGQFGYVCASGVLLTLLSTLFLVPAIASILIRRNTRFIPDLKVNFSIFSGLFKSRPKTIVFVFTIIVGVSIFFALKIRYEQDLFKVFMARGIRSVEVAEMISAKFKSNFSQPTNLSFETEDYDRGLALQRRLDAILANLREETGIIGTMESISYLETPESLKDDNTEFLSKIDKKIPALRELFRRFLDQSNLSEMASSHMLGSFDKVSGIIGRLKAKQDDFRAAEGELQRSWYLARVRGKYRFLTKLRYSNAVLTPEELKAADASVMNAVSRMPVQVYISGPRQSMEAILSTLVSELLRLGIYAVLAVSGFFLLVFRNLTGVILSLMPMLGAFFITLGIMGGLGVGIPFSIIGVAPLIFGLGIDNGIHVISRSLTRDGAPITAVMEHMTRLLIVTSVTSALGFLTMNMSQHYSLQFLGLAMVIGMCAALALTLVPLPAMILLIQRVKGASVAQD
jgi:hypothetical protein